MGEFNWRDTALSYSGPAYGVVFKINFDRNQPLMGSDKERKEEGVIDDFTGERRRRYFRTFSIYIIIPRRCADDDLSAYNRRNERIRPQMQRGRARVQIGNNPVPVRSIEVGV